MGELHLRSFDEAAATGDWLITQDTLELAFVRLVRLEASGKAAAPEGLMDADLAGRFWAIEAGNQGVEEWRQFGNWWGVDLGSVFRTVFWI
ncbi:MAG: hypothetical protein AB1505_13960 [Candidatus Latescibacterota bacterium]